MVGDLLSDKGNFFLPPVQVFAGGALLSAKSAATFGRKPCRFGAKVQALCGRCGAGIGKIEGFSGFSGE
jgi:hypothetical protein